MCSVVAILTLLDVGDGQCLAVAGRRKANASGLSWVEKIDNPGHGPSGSVTGAGYGWLPTE